MEYDKEKLKQMIDSVHAGESLRYDCPACNGRNTFSITGAYNYVMYNCYRASCGFFGRHTLGKPLPEPKNKKDTSSDYVPTPVSTWLDIKDKKLLDLLPEPFKESTTYTKYIRVSSNYYIYVFWYNLLMERSGYEKRLAKHDTRRKEEPKTIRYLRKGDPGIFLPYHSVGNTNKTLDINCPNLLLVENALSAIIVAEVCQEGQFPFLPIATGGAQVSKNQILTLLKLGYKNLYFMYDPDANYQSYKFAKKLGSLFNTGTITLPDKPKDMKKADLYDLLLIYT